MGQIFLRYGNVLAAVIGSIVTLTVALGCFALAGFLVFLTFTLPQEAPAGEATAPPLAVTLGGTALFVSIAVGLIWLWYSKGIFGALPPRAVLHQMRFHKQPD